jgi:hypothetical protein
MWIRNIKELNRFLNVGTDSQLELENGYNIKEKLISHNLYIVVTNSGKARILSYENK